MHATTWCSRVLLCLTPCARLRTSHSPRNGRPAPQGYGLRWWLVEIFRARFSQVAGTRQATRSETGYIFPKIMGTRSDGRCARAHADTCEGAARRTMAPEAGGSCMTTGRHDWGCTPLVLDRLLDDEPAMWREPQTQRVQHMRQDKQAQRGRRIFSSSMHRCVTSPGGHPPRGMGTPARHEVAHCDATLVEKGGRVWRPRTCRPSHTRVRESHKEYRRCTNRTRSTCATTWRSV